MVENAMNTATEKMDEALDSLKRSFQRLRTGRATPDMLEGITVDYYGTATPLNQVGNISIPEARLITIQPWDKTILGDIEKAIFSSELDLTPQNDGNLIRIQIPALTEDTRKDLAKECKAMGEEAKISIRNARRTANSMLKQSLKDKEITEDDEKAGLDDIQKLTDSYSKKVDDAVEVKVADIMEI
ncbi:ribosome recycling factor [Chitinivibrio alkaliphilus]|uniref:Ribosome-recycling factor n=1 Tax=Chitinivibrio alkaliphilus ACht1 TaxID=1313304 RepID=U7D344_9BACT|nr:ribosome recycling factor [Chitinivibrio alkaliphilus]ERP30919.1 ribosome recycling factor [Chitinivibrio alkaliphilus ACht1]